MLWQSKVLNQFPELIHGSTSKQFGVLRLEAAPGNIVEHNRLKLAEHFGFNPRQAILLQQVHEDTIYEANDEKHVTGLIRFEEDLPEADAVISQHPGFTLIIRTADCVPILIYDAKQMIVAAAHAGWLGTYHRLTEKLIDKLKVSYGSQPQNLYIAIGPAICGGDYDVSRAEDNRLELVKNTFLDYPEIIQETEDGVSLDLKGANEFLCKDAGIPPSHIDISPICTLENTNWASYRRDQKELSHSVWSIIGVRHKRH